MSGPASRMLELLSLLQVRREWAGDVLAERLEVSPRTVRRDVDRLRDLGYRIDALRGPAGGYRLSAGSELPPLLFDDEQVIATALALAVAPASGADIAEAAVRALATIRQVMPSRLRHRVDAVEVITASGGTVTDPSVLVAVSEATQAREIFRFDYGAAQGDHRPARQVEPHAVVARNSRWYLLAWEDHATRGDEVNGDWRTFRVDRIRPRARTRRIFAPRPIPGGDAVAFVNARFRGAVGSTSWPCVGTVVLDLTEADIAPYIDDDAVIEEVGPGKTSLTIGSWSWRALAARIGAFDADFTIVGPDELRTAAVEIAVRFSAAQ